MESNLYGMATNADEALAAVRANKSPRQIELETLERYATGKQYDGRKSWFADSVPLWERAPCIVYNITGLSIASNVDLVVGQSRFPAITSNPGEDDEAAGGLDEERSKAVDRALTEILKRVRFGTVTRQGFKHAQQAKSVAVIAGARKGIPFLELVRASWCEPSFDDHRCCTRLEIRYPYIDWKRGADGKWTLRAKLYRRVIDDKADTTYLPIDADKDGKTPADDKWVADKARTIEHKLGFCPVHWYPLMRECSTIADYDGEAPHQEILDEIQALDFALSSRHKSALFAGDPQIIETGVAPGYNPSATGRTASVPATRDGGKASAGNPATGSYQSSGGAPARIKSPGVVWQYEDPNVEVKYLTLPEGALQALDEDGADLRNKVCEALAYCPIDPQNMKFTGEMSGKAIEMLRGRQFDRCDAYRDDVEENWILPVCRLVLRVCTNVEVRLKALDPVRDVLKAYAEDPGAEVQLFVRWPRSYVKADAADETATVTTAINAKNAGIATRRMAVEKCAPIFGVDNVDQALAAIEEEEATKQAQAATIAGGDGTPADGDSGGTPAPGASDKTTPPAAAGAGSNAPPAASPKGAAAPKPQTPKGAAPKASPGANISQAASAGAGVAQSVHDQLAEDFPPDAIAWVRAASWQGPIEVPLDQIDFSNTDDWQASDEPERVQFFVDRIQQGNRKPIVLVNEPNNERLIIVDGHHRALAYKQLGLPAYAYVATVGAVNGPWDEMHGSQRKSKKSIKTTENATP